MVNFTVIFIGVMITTGTGEIPKVELEFLVQILGLKVNNFEIKFYKLFCKFCNEIPVNVIAMTEIFWRDIFALTILTFFKLNDEAQLRGRGPFDGKHPEVINRLLENTWKKRFRSCPSMCLQMPTQRILHPYPIAIHNSSVGNTDPS